MARSATVPGAAGLGHRRPRLFRLASARAPIAYDEGFVSDRGAEARRRGRGSVWMRAPPAVRAAGPLARGGEVLQQPDLAASRRRAGRAALLPARGRAPPPRGWRALSVEDRRPPHGSSRAAVHRVSRVRVRPAAGPRPCFRWLALRPPGRPGPGVGRADPPDGRFRLIASPCRRSRVTGFTPGASIRVRRASEGEASGR